MSDLPTQPGNYYWREKDGDAWEQVKIDSHMNAHFIGGDMCYSVEECGGQWAKAHKPDGGVEVWAVFKGDSRLLSTITYLEHEARYNTDDFNKDAVKCKYTCEPVTIYRKEKE